MMRRAISPRRVAPTLWATLGLVVGLPLSSQAQERGFLERLLRDDPRLAPIAERAAEHRLQVVLGHVEATSDGRSVLRQEVFRDGAEYVYPASTVKLFAAVAALETLADLRRETELPIDAHTPLVFHPRSGDSEPLAEDPSNPEGGTLTVTHEIRKVFILSHNEAYNRLFDLAGAAGLRRSLERAGLDAMRVVHRFDPRLDAAANRRAPRVELRVELGAEGEAATRTIHHAVPPRVAEPWPAPTMPGLAVGHAHLRNGTRVNEALRFDVKNRASLTDLQRGLAMVVRPEVDVGGPGFRLDAADRAFLVETMALPTRDGRHLLGELADGYPDTWNQIFRDGLERIVLAAELRIASKSGQAYGFTLDNAHIMNLETGQEFFLAAAIYTNPNNVLGDDVYTYMEVGEPFLSNLAETVARTLWGKAAKLSS